MKDRWIKSLGMSDPEHQIADDWGRVRDGLFHRSVTFATNSSLRPGHGIVLYASGTGLFFAVGTVTSLPYKGGDDPESGWPWQVDVKLDHWRELVHEGEPLSTLDVDGRELARVIQRRSHVRLSQPEFDAAVAALS